MKRCNHNFIVFRASTEQERYDKKRHYRYCPGCSYCLVDGELIIQRYCPDCGKKLDE